MVAFVIKNSVKVVVNNNRMQFDMNDAHSVLISFKSPMRKSTGKSDLKINFINQKTVKMFQLLFIATE